jgi:2-polyprenyl-3-methyl-5-hydroxy-6-metoxy-1,4-benzoquinol methylase
MVKPNRTATNFSDPKIVRKYGVYPLIHQVVSKPALLKFIGDVKGHRVLDFGCGNGHITHALTQRGALCIGVDPSHTFILAARSDYPNLDFRQIRRSSLEGFKRAQFDKVILSLVLPGLNSKREFKALFQEASKVLKNGGELVLSTLHPLMIRNFKDAFRTVTIPASMNYFSTGAKFKNTVRLIDNTFMSFTNIHWTLEDISNELNINGLVITGIKEPKLPKSKYQSVLKNALHTPYVICIKAKKLANTV